MPTIPERLETATALLEASAATLTGSLAAAAGSASAAAASETAAAGSASAAAADRAQTGLDAATTAADRTATHSDKLAADADAVATAADRVQTGLDRTQTGADRTQTTADAAATAADRTATHSDKLAADADAAATAADRVQTGLDRTQTGADRTATHSDKLAADADAAATAADRVQTGLDRTAASTSATNAATSEANALTSKNAAATSATNAATSEANALTSKNAAATSATNAATSEANALTSKNAAATSATNAAASASAAASSATSAANVVAGQFLGLVAGNAVPATAAAAGKYYIISSAGTSQGITWAFGDWAIYNGSSGSWSQLVSGLADLTTLANRRNTLAPGGAIVMDGSSSTGVSCTLTNQALAADPKAFTFKALIPSANPAANTNVFAIGSTTDGSAAGNLVYGYVNTSGKLEIRLFGATTSDFRDAISTSSVVSLYGGKRVHGAISWNADGTMSVWINATALPMDADTTGGTPPANWLGSITSTYLIIGRRGTTSWVGDISQVALYNCALTASDVLEIFELGGGVPVRFQFGSQVSKITGNDSTMASSSTNWIVANNVTIDTNTTVAGKLYALMSGSGLQRFNCNGVNQLFQKSYRVSLKARLASGSAVQWNFSNSNFTGTPFQFTPTGTEQTFSGTITGMPYGNGANGFPIQFYANPGNGSAYEFDDVTMVQLGAIVHLPLDDGFSFHLRDLSSNGLHAVMTTTGVAHMLAVHKPKHIRGTTSTSGNQQLLGAPLIPTNSQQVRIRARAQSGTPTIKIGTSSGGSEIAAKFTLSTTWQDITLVRTATGSNNFSTLTAGSRTNGDVTVNGAAVGDVVVVNRNDGSPWPQGLSIESAVVAADVARIYLTNNTAGNVTINTVGYVASVFKTTSTIFSADSSIWVNSSTTDVVELDIEIVPLTA